MTAVFARYGSDLPVNRQYTAKRVGQSAGGKPELLFVGQLAEWLAGVRSALWNRRARAAIGRIDCPLHDRANCHRPGAKRGTTARALPVNGIGVVFSLSLSSGVKFGRSALRTISQSCSGFEVMPYRRYSIAEGGKLHALHPVTEIGVVLSRLRFRSSTKQFLRVVSLCLSLSLSLSLSLLRFRGGNQKNS